MDETRFFRFWLGKSFHHRYTMLGNFMEGVNVQVIFRLGKRLEDREVPPKFASFLKSPKS